MQGQNVWLNIKHFLDCLKEIADHEILSIFWSQASVGLAPVFLWLEDELVGAKKCPIVGLPTRRRMVLSLIVLELTPACEARGVC